MRKNTVLLVGLLSFLFGCNSTGSFKKKGGEWYFKDQPIHVNDPPSFTPLGDGYAKDKTQVYYFDTYRKGQEYWLVRHTSTTTLEEADVASFKYLKDYYAADKNKAFFKGEAFTIKDPASFEVLYYGFQRDSIAGYFERDIIAGSDGKTFAALDQNYSKDKNQVYYSGYKKMEDGATDRSEGTTVTVKGADPLSFKVLYDEYASDEKNVYYMDKILTDHVKTFKVLERGYAKSEDKVYYMGRLVTGADVPTFMVNLTIDSTDATDTSSVYFQGKKVAVAK